MKEYTAAFTGPRPQNLPYNETSPQCDRLKTALREEVLRLYQLGVRRYLTGAATGVDIWAGEIVIELHRQHTDMELHCIIPFDGQSEKWSTNDQARYRSIMEQSNVTILSPIEYSGAYRNRNQYLVDHSAYLIAVFDPDKPPRRGGTLMTVNMARRNGLRIIYVSPDTEK